MSEMSLIVRGADAPHVRLAAERRVQPLLLRAVSFLEEQSDDLPTAWRLAMPASERHLMGGVQ